MEVNKLTILHKSWSICSVRIEFIFFLLFNFFYFFKFFKTKKRKKFFDFFVFSKNFSKENFLLIFDFLLFDKFSPWQFDVFQRKCFFLKFSFFLPKLTKFQSMFYKTFSHFNFHLHSNLITFFRKFCFKKFNFKKIQFFKKTKKNNFDDMLTRNILLSLFIIINLSTLTPQNQIFF